MASKEQVQLNAPHAPKPRALEAFGILLPTIRLEIMKSRHDWDKHEPKMWSRATGISDHDLVGNIDLQQDLVEVRSGDVSYGTIIFGKLRVGTNDDEEGFVHIREMNAIEVTKV
ncbi:hypothetical protein FRB98_009009 [Tulasnella sp. 332]|nr:hypothetical protein FRB98_009009 [Tulasnella sp. 332]